MLGSGHSSRTGGIARRPSATVGMSNLFTWADRDRELVVANLTTGKPVIGPHLVPLVKLLTGINQVFPTPCDDCSRDACSRGLTPGASGASPGIRTQNQWIKSPLLCH